MLYSLTLNHLQEKNVSFRCFLLQFGRLEVVGGCRGYKRWPRCDCVVHVKRKILLPLQRRLNDAFHGFHLPIRNPPGWQFISLCHGENQIIRDERHGQEVKEAPAFGRKRCQVTLGARSDNEPPASRELLFYYLGRLCKQSRLLAFSFYTLVATEICSWNIVAEIVRCWIHRPSYIFSPGMSVSLN